MKKIDAFNSRNTSYIVSLKKIGANFKALQIFTFNLLYILTSSILYLSALSLSLAYFITKETPQQIPPLHI